MAKIEKPQAVDDLEAIVALCDAIMVARCVGLTILKSCIAVLLYCLELLSLMLESFRLANTPPWIHVRHPVVQCSTVADLGVHCRQPWGRGSSVLIAGVMLVGEGLVSLGLRVTTREQPDDEPWPLPGIDIIVSIFVLVNNQ